MACDGEILVSLVEIKLSFWKTCIWKLKKINTFRND